MLAHKLPTSTRLTLEASVIPCGVEVNTKDADEIASKRRWSSMCLNESLIAAGAPFRMIELELAADGEHRRALFRRWRDRLHASGSTAYNVSAGGPIISPNVEAICVTPLCPHSLSFRPVVVGSEITVSVFCKRVNEGTMLICDGQASIQAQRRRAHHRPQIAG